MIDDVYTGNSLVQSSVSLTNATLIGAQGPVFPNVLPTPTTGPIISGWGITLDVLSPKLKTPYSEQANVTVERQLSSSMVFSVSGIFSRGVNLYGTRDINLPQPGGSYTYTIDN